MYEILLLFEGKFGMCCPYFISTQLSEVADIVFAPYIYLIDPIIRFASKIDLTDSIIVIDEAHNIEETCREATSFEVIYIYYQSLLIYI